MHFAAVLSNDAKGRRGCERAGVGVGYIDGSSCTRRRHGSRRGRDPAETDRRGDSARISGFASASAASILIALTRLHERRAALSGRLVLLLGFGPLDAGQSVRLA